MIAFNENSVADRATWQVTFSHMLPQIEQRLRNTFRKFDVELRDEIVAEGIAHCLFAYVRLHSRGRCQFATPYTLTFYATKHVKSGRPAASRMTSTDPLSRYAQVNKGIRVDRRAAAWIEAIVEDKRASVPDQVAAKLDFASWFGTLSRRMKRIAKDLALGMSTSEVALRHGITAGRISQMRRSLEQSWVKFAQDPV